MLHLILPNCQALAGDFLAMTCGFDEIFATIKRPLSENELGAALSLAF
jgi:hypothetical protein